MPSGDEARPAVEGPFVHGRDLYARHLTLGWFCMGSWGWRPVSIGMVPASAIDAEASGRKGNPVADQSIEVLAVLDDGKNVKNSSGEKAVAVLVSIEGLGERTLVITPGSASKLYDAVCAE